MFLGALVAYPLLLGVLAIGLGLLVERLAAVPLPGALVAPIGFAALVCVSQLGTQLSATATLTAPLLVVLAVAGLALGRTRLLALRSDWRAALPAGLLAVATFGVFAAPVLLSGHAGWTSYGVDTTPPIHWLGAEHLASQGHSFPDAGRSAATTLTAGFFSLSYPAGGNTALGVTAQLSGVGVPWLFQPFLAACCALLGLVLLALLRDLVSSRWLAAAMAFVAAQPALLYASYLQGQVKEVIAALCVALLAATVLVYARTFQTGWRAVLPLAVAGAAGMAATGVGFVAWLGPAAVLALVPLARARWRADRRLVALHIGAFVLASVALALPAVLGTRAYFQSVSNLVSNEVTLGSLLRPLSPLQIAGIWWSGDYRLPPTANAGINFGLIGAVGVGGLLAAEWALRRRAWPLIVYVIVAVPGCLALARQGTPWIDAKAMVIAAPPALLLGLVGSVAALAATPARIAGRVLASAIAAGVLLSNAMLYHSTHMSPTARYQELEHVGERFAGQGPTLRPDFDDYAVYFTRDMDPDAPGDARPAHPARLLGGATAGYGTSLRLDQLAPAYLQQFPTLLLQRSPFESRPPANYRRVWSGRYYEVWRRGSGRVLEHLPAGSMWSPAGDVNCADVRRLARLARRQGATLAVSEPPALSTAELIGLPLPRGWRRSQADPHVMTMTGQGRLDTTIPAPFAGRFDVWLAGSFTRPVHVLVDGRRVGAPAGEIKYSGLAQKVGTLPLTAGVHRLELARPGGSLTPGDGADGAIGPAALTPAPEPRRTVSRLAPSDWREACERPVDWVELVAGVPRDGP